MIVVNWPASKRYAILLCRHGTLFLPILLCVSIAIAGRLGQTYGVPDLFLDDGNPLSRDYAETNIVVRLLGSAIFETQVYATSLLGFTWVTLLLMEDYSQRRANPSAGGSKSSFPFVLAAALLSLVPL